MMRVMVAVVVLALSGCAHHVRTENVMGPNGKAAYAMRCGNMPACFKEAGVLCPRGYDRLDQTMTVSGGGIGGGDFGISSTKTRGSMLIECK